ncbi:MAG: glycerate kinase [Salinivenus sp.]
MTPTDQCVSDAKHIFRSAVQRVQADRLLEATPPEAWVPAPLSSYSRIRVAGMGKAAMAMAGVLEASPDVPAPEGTVIVPDGYPATFPERLPAPAAIEVRTGGHPLPSEEGVRGARRIQHQAQQAEAGELLVVLVSGGGTALSTVPVDALDLADLRTTYRQLLQAGMPIGPANAVRKHLTQLGGGQLAQAAHPADVVGLAVSDVVGDDLATVASGPTVPDPTTYEAAMRALYRYDLWHEVPEPVRSHLAAGARGKRPETPSEGHMCFESARTTRIGSNQEALEAARAAAEDRGYAVRSVTKNVTGDARTVGGNHARRLRRADVEGPTCWLWGGEPTVTVTGDGTGGRNQEVALSAALALETASQPMALLSGGTDGIDGPTDAAGGWATPRTAKQARNAGLDPVDHLKRNDSYTVLEAVGQLLRPGPTHTNVMDVHVGLVRPVR